MNTPVNARTLKQHFAYNWWLYLLSAVLAVVLVNLLFTVTAYHPPEDKKVEFFVYGYTDNNALEEYLAHVRETEMEDMEEVSSLMLLDDSNYGPMQLMTYLAAGEGDVFLLPREQFLSVASSSGLLPLEGDEELLALFSGAGISLQSGWRKNTDTGETHLYGIPQSKLPGLEKFAWAKDGYLCVLATGGNDVNAMKFLRILCRDTLK